MTKLAKSVLRAASVLSVLLAVACQAKASTIYDNGPIAGIDAYTINNGYSVSDSFTVSSLTTLTSAQVGLWMVPGAAPSGLVWEVGTYPFAANIGNGVASLSDTSLGTNMFGYTEYESVFSIPSTPLSPGSYYFTLTDATSSESGAPVYWDRNLGPSTATQDYLGSYDGNSGSESFQLYSNPTPEPTPITLLASGFFAAGGFGLCRRRRATTAN